MADENKTAGASATDVKGAQGGAAAAPVAAAPAGALETVEQRVRHWMDNHLAGGPLARNTEMWNELHRALPALVKILEA